MMYGKRFFYLLFLPPLLGLVFIPSLASAFMDQFTDPQDGALDMSQWLVERKGFLPIPLVVSDPAVGYGLGAGLAFFHKSEEDIKKAKQKKEDEMLSLSPSISFAAGVWGLPFVQMRGIPSLRYQGENVFVTEVEPRWDFTERWSAVGFAGIGWTAAEIYELGDYDGEVAYGLGFRYLVARRMGLRAGLDVARGPEDTVVYVFMGSSWR